MAGTAMLPAHATGLSRQLAKAQDLGAVPSGTMLTATIRLPMADKAGFESALNARYTLGSPVFHKWMSADDLASYGPKASDIAKVRAALTGFGLTVSRTSKSGTSLMVRGDAAALHRAFGAQVHSLLLNGRTVVANNATLQPQGDLAGRVLAVSGLSGSTMHPMNVHPTDASGAVIPGIPVPAKSSATPGATPAATSPLDSFTNVCFGNGSALLSNATTQAAYDGVTYAFSGKICAYTPSQIAHHYGIDQAYNYGVDGTGQTIVIVDAYGSPTALADANTFFAATGVKPFDSSNFSIITPLGAPKTADYGWAGETALDIELAHAIAPGAKIVLLVVPDNYDTSFIAGLQYAVDNKLGNVISNSYGEPESEADPADEDAYNQIAMEAAAQGITLNFSSGDSGDNGVGKALGAADSPANSPWVAAVGGTSLDVPSKGGPIETGWGNTRSTLGYSTAPLAAPLLQGFYAGAGGGESAYFAKPFWQSDLAGTGRQVPDLGAIADPYTGAVIVEPTSATTPSVFTSIGGTSLASPVFSAMWALVDQASGLNINTGTYAAGQSFGIPGPMLRYYGGSALADAKPVDPTVQVSGTITTGGSTTNYDGFSLLGIPAQSGVLTTLRQRSDGGYSVLSFNTDSSLPTTTGYDNVTGRGVPSGPGAIAVAMAIIAAYQHN